MRPLGDVAVEMLNRAGTPTTVRRLCEQAQVGYVVGRYTASRLVDRGALVVVGQEAVGAPSRAGRPASLVVAASAWVPAAAAQADEGDGPVVLSRSFWERGPQQAAD